MQNKNTKNQTMTSFHNSTEQFIQKAVTNINKIKVYDNSVQNSESFFFQETCQDTLNVLEAYGWSKRNECN